MPSPAASSSSPASGSTSSRQIPSWAPLRLPIFRALWIAGLASNIGSWMHEVGAAWMMTTLSQDPRLTAAIQAAGALPPFLLALPAGALADILDKRKLIAVMQAGAALTAGGLGLATLFGWSGPGMLLFFTAVLSTCGALTGPAMQSVTPEIVKKRELPTALSLGGVSFNISRVIGPALGGIILWAATKAVGGDAAPGILFLCNAVSFGGVVIVMTRWKRVPVSSDLPAEHVVSAILTGWRYMRHSPELISNIIRLFGFFIFSCVLWSLLPLFGRQSLGLDAFGYGTILGSFGIGAIIAGLTIGKVRARFGSHRLIVLSSAGVAAQLVVLAQFPHNPWIARAAMLLGGFFWPWAMLTFNLSILGSVPGWVRSRAAGVFLLTFMGAQLLGSFIWGSVAHKVGIPVAFQIAAIGLLVTIFVLRPFKLTSDLTTNLNPSLHWPDPEIAFDPSPEEGPVLITVEYRVSPESADDFLVAMRRLRSIRLRDGAMRWNVFQDISDPDRWVESVLVESWNEYLRQHARITFADREIEEVAHSYHVGEEPPRITHMVSATWRRPEPADTDQT